MSKLRMVLVTLGVTASLVCASSLVAHAAMVKLQKQEGLESAEYLVEGAEGANKGEAVMEARKAAVVYAAKAMTNDRREKTAIGAHMKENMDALVGFSMSRAIRGKGVSDDGKRLRLKVVVVIQTKELRLALVEAGVLTDDTDLAETLGTPSVIVSYGKLIREPGKRKLTDLGRVLTSRVTSFFTDKLWNIVDGETLETARNNQEAQAAMKGLVGDPNVELALATGADIYVTFDISRAASGRQVTADIKAVDTVTGKNLGTTVHNSKTYDSSTRWEKVYAEGLMNAMPKFFEQIRGYWQLQAKKGRQYMFVVKTDEASPLTKDRRRAIRDVLKDLGKWKRKTRTETQYDGILASTLDVDDIVDDFEDGLEDAGFEEVKIILANGTLFMYQVR